MASSSSEVETGHAMDIERVPAALQERLGFEATSGLLQLLDSTSREWRADVIAGCTDRFERRLVEEIASVRVQIAQVEASVRRDMAEMGAGIRQDMTAMEAGLRRDMTELGTSLRREMTELSAGLHREMASGRVELLKWCFLFWIGQVIALAGIMGMMFRLFRP
jgi:hypothetical protein